MLQLTVDCQGLDTHQTYTSASTSDESDLFLLVTYWRGRVRVRFTLPLTSKTLASSKSALLVLDIFEEDVEKYFRDF